MHCISRVVIIRSLVVTTVSLLASAPARSGGVTCDGDISDIRAFNEPGAPPPVELIDPYGGFADPPIQPSQILGQLCSPNCVSPSGFNVGSVVLAYDPGNDAYYIGLDVSPFPGDDTAFANGSGAWDSDGDGDPNILTDGPGMTPPILYDVPIPGSGLTDKYAVSLDVGHDGTSDVALLLEDAGYGPALRVMQHTGPPECVEASAGWTVGDYAGNGPDVELAVRNVSCLGLPACDYYKVRIQVFAETEAGGGEELVIHLFEFDMPFMICKVDQAGAAVPAWTFTVNGESVTTGDDGCVTVWLPPDPASLRVCDTLPEGIRVCDDGVHLDGVTLAPSGSTGTACVDTNPADAFCNTMTWCNEACFADLLIRKEGCSGPLAVEDRPGWEITLTHPDGSSEVCVTDDSGCCTFTDLPVGIYTITETVKPGWRMCDGETGERTVEITCDDHGTLIERVLPFRNEVCWADLLICKEGCATPLAGANRAGWEITLTHPDGSIETRVTDDSGCVTFSSLPVGDYTVSETLLPGWPMCDGESGSRTVTLRCADHGTTVAPPPFRNGFCLANIHACKTDCGGEPLAGWGITLTGPFTWSAVTDHSGCVTFPGLLVGDYTVAETLLPGWRMCDGEAGIRTVTLTCDNDGQTVALDPFRNELCLANIIACTVDCQGHPLAGWEITLAGPVTGSYRTGADGCAVLRELPIGIYEVCEVVPPGFMLCDDVIWPSCQTVEITCGEDGETIPVEFRNRPPCLWLECCLVSEPEGPTSDEVVQFIDCSTETPPEIIVAWNWTFGDGSASSEQDPTHQYASSGLYEVCLEVITDCGHSAICCSEVTVNVGCECDVAIDRTHCKMPAAGHVGQRKRGQIGARNGSLTDPCDVVLRVTDNAGNVVFETVETIGAGRTVALRFDHCFAPVEIGQHWWTWEVWPLACGERTPSDNILQRKVNVRP